MEGYIGHWRTMECEDGGKILQFFPHPSWRDLGDGEHPWNLNKTSVRMEFWV